MKAFAPHLKETESPFVIGVGVFGQETSSRKYNNQKINVTHTTLHSKVCAALSCKKRRQVMEKKNKINLKIRPVVNLPDQKNEVLLNKPLLSSVKHNSM